MRGSSGRLPWTGSATLDVGGKVEWSAMRDINGSAVLTPSLGSLGTGAPDSGEEARMQQIRELLHGDLKRQHEARIAALELRIHEMQTGIIHQLDALSARLDALSVEVGNVRREHLDELARGFQDMGDRVRRLVSRE